MGTNISRFKDDEEFFIFVKFRDLMKGTEEFCFQDLCLGSNDDDIYNRLLEMYDGWLQNLPVRIEKDTDFQKTLAGINKKIQTDRNRSEEVYRSIVKKLEKDAHLSFDEVGSISWLWPNVYNAVRFMPTEYELTKQGKTELCNKVSEYLTHLENDVLKINRSNYYRFDLQKKAFIECIEQSRMIAKYGTSFVLSEDVGSHGLSKRDEHFLFIQTAYALEDMGYLSVMDIWQEVVTTDYTYRVHINVDIHDVLLAELKQEYQKQNPKNLFERFDAKTGILKFAGQEILLGKKGKETDAIRLMKTLISIEPDEWIERGEVYTDWGLSKDDREQMAKNKIYYAKQAINEAVARKTKIEDFIEGGTIKWRINPRYHKKVDE